MNRKAVRVIAIILALVMLVSIGFIVLEAIASTTPASANTATTRAEIDRLRGELRVYQQRRSYVQAQINAIEFERRTETARKYVLDDRIMITGQQIDNLELTIMHYGVLIEEKELEVEAAQEREAHQFALFKARVRSMEENGVISYLEIVFDSTGFADLLARIDFVADIMRADEQTYFDLIAAREATEAAQLALEETVLEREAERDILEELEEELRMQVEEAEELIAILEDQQDTEQELFDKIAADEARILRDIRQAEERLRQQEAAAAAARQAQNIVRGTGELTWPVPGHRRVTSGFGSRMHPVFRVMRHHSGIDIGAPHGANVVAADRGTVITSAYNSSFGNFIVIAHGENANGDRITTLYAHLQSRSVRQGDVVQRGQSIGRVGSTGVSTGPHLHFEVTVNGTRVNPMRFL